MCFQISGLIGFSEGTESIQIYSEPIEVHACSNLKVPVKIKNNTGMMGFKITIGFDTKNLSAVSVESGDVLDGGLQDNIGGDAKPGSINIYWAGNENVCQNGILFYVNFKVSESAHASEKISISFSQEDTFNADFEDVFFECSDISVRYLNEHYVSQPTLSLSMDTNELTVGETLIAGIAVSDFEVPFEQVIELDFDSEKFEYTAYEAVGAVDVTVESVAGGCRIHTVLGDSDASGEVFVYISLRARGAALQGTVITASGENCLADTKNIFINEPATPKSATMTAQADMARYGEHFKVFFSLAEHTGIMGFGVKIGYNSELLKPVSVSKGTLCANGTLSDSIGIREGEFTVLWNHTQNVYDEGTAFSVEFECLTKQKLNVPLLVESIEEDCFNESWEDVTLIVPDTEISCNMVDARIYAQPVECSAGETVQIPIKIENVGNLAGYKLTIGFDESAFEPVSVTPGDFGASGLEDNIEGDSVPGSINVYWTSTTPITSAGILFYVSFRVSGAASGEYSIRLSYSPTDTFDEDFDSVALTCESITVHCRNEAVDNLPKVTLSADTSALDEQGTFDVVCTLSRIGSLKQLSVPVYFNTQYLQLYAVKSDNLHFLYNIKENRVEVLLSKLSEASEGKDFTLTFKRQYTHTRQEPIYAQAASFIGSSVQVDVPAGTSENNITLQAKAENAYTGETFRLHFGFSGNLGLMGFRLRIHFDSTKVTPVGTVRTGWNVGTLSNSIGNKENEFDIVWNGTENCYQDGEAFAVEFSCLESSVSTSQFEIEYLQPDTFNETYEDVVLDCNNASVLINPAKQMRVTFSPRYMYVGENDLCKVSLKDSNDDIIGLWSKKGGYISGSTDYLEEFHVVVKIPKYLDLEIRNYKGSYIADVDITNYLQSNKEFDWNDWSLGDVNGDNAIDMADVSCILAQSNYAKAVARADNKNCDLDVNNTVDIGDVAVILKEANYAKQGTLVLNFAGI